MKALFYFIALTVFALIAIPISPLHWIYFFTKEKWRYNKDFYISPFASIALFVSWMFLSPIRVIISYFNVLWSWRPENKLKDDLIKIIMWGLH